jgi:HEPN domain-containing protein
MDEPLRELVRDWLTRAHHDLRSARALASLEDPLLDTAIYHCQQAAEKSVKAWLQSNDDPFPKTHDIGDLVKRAALIDPNFAHFAEAASILTPYVSAFRYPGGSDEFMPTRDEFEKGLNHAQGIYDFVLNLLPAEAGQRK